MKTLLLTLLCLLSLHSTTNACTCKTVTDPSGTETWTSSNKPFNGNTVECITVAAGKTLIIENLNLKLVCKAGTITVQPGGRLIMKGCTIESGVDNDGYFYGFEGIKVEGNPVAASLQTDQMVYYRTTYNPTDPNFPQFGGYSADHGVLVMQNCTIKYVLRYIDAGNQTGGLALESYNGGILELYQCTFYNNYSDLIIKDYEKERTNVDLPNQFNIINCNFIKEPDENEIIKETDYSKVSNYVRLFDVKRVQMEGCHFENNFAYRDQDSRYAGIVIFNSSLYMQKSGFDRNANSLDGVSTNRWSRTTKCPIYNQSFARVNRFKNLSYGIKSCGSSDWGACDLGTGIGTNKLGLLDCYFENCKQGIDIHTSDDNSPDVKVTIARNLYLFQNSSLFGDLDAISFVNLKSINKAVVTENAADVSSRYVTDGLGAEMSGSNLPCSLLVLNEGKTPEYEVYRNKVAIEDNGTTYQGLTCSGSRDKTYPTVGLFLGIHGTGSNDPQEIWFGCNDFNHLSEAVVIKPNTYLLPQGNGNTEDKHDLSSENNFSSCELPYIKWSRSSYHANNNHLLVYLFDDSDPDPTNTQVEIEESAASNYNCGSIGCRKWPNRYINPETSLQPPLQKEEEHIQYQAAQHKLRITSPANSQIERIAIFDLQGRLLLNLENPGTEHQLDLKALGLANALYLVSATWNNGMQSSQKITISQ